MHVLSLLFPLPIGVYLQKQSPNLCKLLGGLSEIAQLKEGEVRLFQCFLDTQRMICQPENPNPLREDEVILELIAGGGHRRKYPRTNVATVDPLHQLFVPNDPEQTGEKMIYAILYMYVRTRMW